VLDDQQEAARRHGACRRSQNAVARKLHWRVQVLGGDEVEGARRKGVGEVVLLEVDPGRDAGRGGVRRRPFEGGGGHVDGGHPPAKPG
jgi:hypothetical protein